jgi:iron complex outermembrane receptor protein
MVLPTFKSETLDSTELGFKTEFFDGRALANIAIFDYTYKNLQVQGTDPDVFKGGVVNIPESEVQGLELEFTASLSDSWTIDANFAYLDSEITSSFEYLDNAKAQQYSFGGESNRYALREDVKGKELAKTPEITADISLIYSTQLASGDVLNSSLQFVKRGKFFQRIVNNPVQDPVDGYEIINFSSGVDYASGWGFDIMVTNVGDEDGMNSAMTDVFGVGATGIEYIPPRQVMTRLSYDF